MKPESYQKLDQQGRPTGKSSLAKIGGSVLFAVGVLIICASAVTEVMAAAGTIPDVFPLDRAFKWGGGSIILGSLAYAGEVTGLIDRIPKIGG